ncbi:VacJ family lipoprotein [Hyphococcus sp. DH-69]|uniref:MlaA family lipoprotein n=1 Tax=Hyphococcus formosus TaxID=3143534 RepID=UPI00398A8564
MTTSVLKKAILPIALCVPLVMPAHAQLTGAADPDSLATELENTPTETTAVADPWEGFNRKMFSVNNSLDRALFVPAAKAYRAVTHKKQRKGIRNFLANLRTPVILVNDILQGEFGRAGNTASRFVVNSTIGFGGMGDPAERMGIAQHSEDFGQTLAVWGVKPGPYLVLPFFGPSTLRDGMGAGVDIAIDPAIWIRTDPAKYFRYTRAGTSLLSAREPLIEPLADIEADSLDYYASIRSFYLQSRKREISNGRTNFDDLPDIGDFEEFDELE